MAASGNDYDDLCESVENCSLNSSRSDDRTEPKSSIGIESLPPPAVRSRSKGDNSLSRSNQTTPKTAPPSCSEHSVGTNSSVSSVPGNPSSLSRSLDLEENGSMSSETPSASQSLPSSRYLFTQTQTSSNTQTISVGQINIETSAPVNHYQKDEIDPKLKQTVEDLRKILELLNKESSKDIKPLDVAQLTGIGNNKKSVSKLLHFLKNKNLLTLKTEEKGANPRWSRHPTNTYTDKNLREWAAELHNKSRPESEAIPIIELKGHTFNVDEGKSVAIECNIIYEKKYRPPFWERIHENDETNILTIREDKKDKYIGLKCDSPFLRILNSEMSDGGYYRCCIEYSTSNGEETVRSKKAHLIVEKAVKPGDTHIDQQVNIKVNTINADTINMGGDETNIIVEKPNTSVGSTSSSSSENEMSVDEINSACGDVDIK